MTEYDFSDYVVLITGGAKGLGFGTAAAFRERGAAVVIGDVAEAERAAERLGARAMGIRMDVTDPHSVRGAVAEASGRFGPVSILVNNAGICSTEGFETLSLESWERILSVNLTGAFTCMQAVVPGMRESGGGAVVNIGSLAGRSGGIMVSAAYSAAKAGVAGLSRAAAKQLAGCGIRVNCVAPSTLETDMTAGWDRKALKKIADSVPLGKLGTVSDVVGTILFLASPAAAYITGATIDVNGGLFIAP